MVVCKGLMEFLSVKISLKYGLWEKGSIPLELKLIETWQIKEICWCHTRAEAELGNFSPDLVCL